MRKRLLIGIAATLAIGLLAPSECAACSPIPPSVEMLVIEIESVTIDGEAASTAAYDSFDVVFQAAPHGGPDVTAQLIAIGRSEYYRAVYR